MNTQPYSASHARKLLARATAIEISSLDDRGKLPRDWTVSIAHVGGTGNAPNLGMRITVRTKTGAIVASRDTDLDSARKAGMCE